MHLVICCGLQTEVFDVDTGGGLLAVDSVTFYKLYGPFKEMDGLKGSADFSETE